MEGEGATPQAVLFIRELLIKYAALLTCGVCVCMRAFTRILSGSVFRELQGSEIERKPRSVCGFCVSGFLSKSVADGRLE